MIIVLFIDNCLEYVMRAFSDLEQSAHGVTGCIWKLVSNFVSPKTALGNSHFEVRKTQNTFKIAFA